MTGIFLFANDKFSNKNLSSKSFSLIYVSLNCNTKSLFYLIFKTQDFSEVSLQFGSFFSNISKIKTIWKFTCGGKPWLQLVHLMRTLSFEAKMINRVSVQSKSRSEIRKSFFHSKKYFEYIFSKFSSFIHLNFMNPNTEFEFNYMDERKLYKTYFFLWRGEFLWHHFFAFQQ